MLTGDNGLFKKVEEAKNSTELEATKEQIKLAYLASQIDRHVNNNSKNEVAQKVKEELKNSFPDVNTSVSGETINVYIKDKIYQIDENGNVTQLEYSVNSMLPYIKSSITNQKTNITKIYFNHEDANIIEQKYNNATIKEDLTSNNIGKVYAWLEDDAENSGKYILYIESDGITELRELNSLFSGYTSLKSIYFNNVDTKECTKMSWTFESCTNLETLYNISSFNTKNVNTFAGMFANCTKLTSLDLNNFDTTNSENMENMFIGCENLTSLKIDNFNTKNTTNMKYMFQSCSKLSTLNVTSFNTENVTTMKHMFNNCSSLEELDLSSFDTKNVTDIEMMVSNCTKLKKIYVSSSWNINSGVRSTFMFGNDTLLVGGAGTTFDSNYTNSTYARIDGENNEPGYFTNISNKNQNVEQQGNDEEEEYSFDTKLRGNPITPKETNNGIRQVTSSNVYAPSETYKHNIYDVTENTYYYISGSSASNPTSYPMCCFFNENNEIVEKFGLDKSTTYKDELIQSPQGAVKLIVNQALASGPINVCQAVPIKANYSLKNAETLVEQANQNPFSFNALDKGYVSFVVDDLIVDVDSIASIFEEYGYPVTLAAIPKNLDVKATALTENRGNYTPGMKMREIMSQVVADGGEIMAHNYAPVVSTSNQDDYEFMYGYFVKTKKELELAGFTVRGIMRAGGTGAISGTPQIERWLIGNYDYSNMGTAVNYIQERSSINQDMSTIKNLIDNAVTNKSWLKFMVHGYQFGNGQTFRNEQDLREILSYCRDKGIQVVTYSYMFDNFGSK